MRFAKSVSLHASKLSIRVQIGLAAAALSLALVIATAATTGYFGAQQMSRLIRDDLAATARVFADRLNATLASRYFELRTLSRLQALQPVWQSDPRALREALEELQSNYSDYSWIGFADTKGTVIAATGGMIEGVSVAARPWFKSGLQGPTVEDVHEAQLLAKLLGARPSGEPFRFVDIAFPVRDAGGQTIGVLCAHLSWDFASSLRRAMLDASYPTANAELWILSRDGQVLLGHGGSDSFDAERFARLKKDRAGGFADRSTDPARLVGFATVDSRSNYPGLEWIVVARQTTAAALAPVYSMIWKTVAAGLVAALVGLVLALLIARGVSRPLQALTKEADKLGREPGTPMLSRYTGSLEVVHLSTALRSLLRRTWLAEERTQEAERRASEGAEQYAHDLKILQRMADTDPLTNLMNRRAFLVAANDAFEYYRRYGRPIAALVVDIDHFKRVNDTYGHAAGDAVIRRVGELIADSLRTTDKLGRVGGEEFVVMLREVDEEQARTLANRAREKIAASPIGFGNDLINVTISIGVTLVDKSDRDIQDTIERADRALYMAKNTGRNRAFLLYPPREAEQRQVA